MSNVPSWHAVTSGISTGQAGDINQFHGSHPTSFSRQGTAVVSGPGSSTGGQSDASNTWIDQPFTMSGTTITRIELEPLTSGGTGMDSTISIRTDNGSGLPTTTVLYSVVFPADFQPGVSTFVSLPCNLTGLTTSALYHIVVVPAANSSSNYLRLSTGTTTGHALNTSTNSGGTWSAGSVTLQFNVFSGSGGCLRNTAEDGVTTSNSGITGTNSAPSKWTGIDYNLSSGANTTPGIYREYVGTIRSVRLFSYTSGALTGVT